MSSSSLDKSPPAVARRRLFAVGLLVVLPLLVFFLLLARTLVNQQRAALHTELKQIADFGARELAREVRVIFATLDSLATSDAALNGDYAAMHAHASRVVAVSPRIGGVSAFSADGVVLFTTSIPFGARMPTVAPTDTDKKVLETGLRQVSPLHVAPLSGKKQVLFIVPVKKDDKTVMVLRASMWTEAIGEVVYEQPVPPSWSAAVVDQNMIQIARSRDAARFVGQPATEITQAAIHAGSTAPYAAVSRDGVAMTASMVRVSGTPWTVAVAAPSASINAEAWRAFQSTLWIGLVCAGLSALGLWLLVRTLRKQKAHAATAPDVAPEGVEMS